MRGTLLFIHGTGVRKAGYEATLASLKTGVANAGGSGIDVRGFLWGDVLGVKITEQLVDSILPAAATRAIGDDATQWEAQLWGNLLDDPLLELRFASIRAPAARSSAGPIPGQTASAGEIIRANLIALDEASARDLPGGVGPAELPRAAKFVASSEELRDAAASAPSLDDPEFIDAVARAIVARTLAQSRGDIGTGPDALYDLGLRRELVADVAKKIGPQTRSLIGNWLQAKLKATAEKWATGYGKKRRTSLMVGTGPSLGDILYYQRHGDVILDTIARELKAIDAGAGPVVALGHSLGGIMLVDLLSRSERPEVQKLITVGSQAPAIFMCDALQTMRLNRQFPADTPFMPWQNFYDRNDFLSFCASRCFPGQPTGIEDKEIISGVSFPEAHGAYFRQKNFYEEIIKGWPK